MATRPGSQSQHCSSKTEASFAVTHPGGSKKTVSPLHPNFHKMGKTNEVKP